MIRSWVLVLACTVLTVRSSAAAVSAPALVPVADAYVTPGPSGNLADDNFGAAGALSVAAPGSSKGEFQSVLRFDTSAAKSAFDAAYGAGGWTLQSASLQLTAAASNNPSFNASAAGTFAVSFMADDSWVEGTGTPNAPTTDGITWNTLPATLASGETALGTVAFNGATSGAATYALGLPLAFTNDVATGAPVSIHLLAADSSVSYLFNSRSFGTASARPQLMLTATAVPEPATLAVAAWALGALLLMRRKAP